MTHVSSQCLQAMQLGTIDTA